MPISWTKDLDTGIELIDEQHRHIVELVNRLETVGENRNFDLLHKVIDECVEYTLSHFAFEEEIQEVAGYEYRHPHKKVHELFTRRVREYRTRLDSGEDVTDELHGMLSSWLVNHIKHDDADYVPAVMANIDTIIQAQASHKGPEWYKRFFYASK